MFFYDPSVVDGTDEDDAARALRDAEETSCCATCFLIDVRKHMVSKKTKLHHTSSTSTTTKTPVQSAVECLDTFLKNRIISSPNDKVSENLNAIPPPLPPRNRMSRCSTTTTTHKNKNGRTHEPWLLTLSFFFFWV